MKVADETKTRLYDGFALIGRSLSSGRRLEILDVLAQSPGSVEELADEIGQTAANVSQHLQILASAGLVTGRRCGRQVVYSLQSDQVAELLNTVRNLAVDNIESVNESVSDHLSERTGVHWITRVELARRMRRDDVTVLDVRPARDLRGGTITGSISVPFPQLRPRIGELRRDRDVVVCCRGPFCVFGDKGTQVLLRGGFNAMRLEDGVPEWIRYGFPSTLSA